MKKRLFAAALSITMVGTLLSGCSISTTSTPESDVSGTTAAGQTKETADEAKDLKGREEISLWFWGAEPYAQEAMQKILADKYNSSQDKYVLSIEFLGGTVDTDISTALSANQGPDIVYGSGPSFVMPFAEAGKLEPLDRYSEQYGWKDRLLQAYYESGTVGGKLYSLTNGISTMGVFYNKKVLEANGWEIPKTIEDMESIMDEALAKGLYASVTGNKEWKPVNENYASLFLTHIAGPETVYKCLTGEEKWNNPNVTAAMEKSKEWWDKGYLAGEDYVNLNFSESLQLLADEKSPFFIGPSIAFQWAASFFTGDKTENIAFIPFPATETVPDETYTLGAACTFSINANALADHKDEAAKIIDMMMQPEFTQEITTAWPGYWGTPLKDLSAIDTSNMGYLSKSFVDVIKNVSNAVNEGNFGFYDNVFFPATTQQDMVNIEDIWYDTVTISDYLDKVDKGFEEDFAKGLVPAIPAPSMK